MSGDEEPISATEVHCPPCGYGTMVFEREIHQCPNCWQGPEFKDFDVDPAMKISDDTGEAGEPRVTLTFTASGVLIPKGPIRAMAVMPDTVIEVIHEAPDDLVTVDWHSEPQEDFNLGDVVHQLHAHPIDHYGSSPITTLEMSADVGLEHEHDVDFEGRDHTYSASMTFVNEDGEEEDDDD